LRVDRYGTHTVKKGYFSDSIIKIEVLKQSTKIWSPKGNYLPCEPIFVASPNATSEDDGVILTVALEAERKLSTLIILDAKEMREIGRAE
jgi:torulene dioxygenase